MTLSNVKLIFGREVRDQLRDRRTLFMIFVLPLMLYPLLGLSFFQVAQFLRDNPSQVLVVGLPNMPELPPLAKNDAFDPRWLPEAGQGQGQLFKLQFRPHDAGLVAEGEAGLESLARNAIDGKQFQAVLVFPRNFAEQLERYRQRVLAREMNGGAAPPEIPRPKLFYSDAEEKSQMAFARVTDVTRRWIEAIGQQILSEGRFPATAARPFEVEKSDVSVQAQRDSMVWSKILPFVVLLWALTGAFYPAIDLCAGEKERGTLETLLCSPAERSEIVTGKLLTVMLFSMATSVLNLVSMGLTGTFVIGQLQSLGAGPNIGLPPVTATLWLLVALVPVSLLFSALCLALASFARSNKEGQYYLMPAILVAMPLAMLPMAPGVELTLGNSLIPLSGLLLLLRSLLEGNYAEALTFLAPVAAVTLGCCWLALRWAVEQFQKESVLFRESERFELGLWLKQMVRDRQDTPTAAEAIFCGALILVIEFFMSFALPAPGPNTDLTRFFVTQVLVTQLVVIATPALVMALFLSRRPRETLLLRLPTPQSAWPALVLAPLLAVVLHPWMIVFRDLLLRLYPMSDSLGPGSEALQKSLQQTPWWLLALLVAALPAMCEELAFRGFILSGLRRLGSRWRAIILSSVFFGITHTLFQQSLTAAAVGLLLGYIAVQTGSLWPGMLFHGTHNFLQLAFGVLDEDATRYFAGQSDGSTWFDRLPWLAELVVRDPAGGISYQPLVLTVCALFAVTLVAWFARLPGHRSEEELLRERIVREDQSPTPLAAVADDDYRPTPTKV